jgi:hypothetical protein
MTSENDNIEYRPKEDEEALEIPAKKYSTIVEFQEDLESESEDLDKNEKEKKENEDNLKQQVLNHWSKLLVKEPPKRRTCHTSFIHDSYLYVVGGIDITERKQDDIYKVNIKEPNSSWIKIDTLGEKFGKIAYHAGVEVDGFYYIVGGQDETLTTLNTIQVFDITQERMGEKIKLEPEKFPPLESHTVNNYNNQSLIIYGGMSGKDYNKHVYSFDIQTKEVKNLTENLGDDKMPPPRQDHAAVLYNGCLYVYGGIGPDSKIYDDMWKFNLSDNTWEQLKTQNQIDKENRKKQKKMEKEKEQNGEKIEEEEETDDDDDEEDIEEDKKDIRPKGRSGHSMVCVGDMFYIFGGKTGLIKESNEIWEFNPNDINYGCVHETLLEQFTKEELNRISAENKDDKQGFRWLTRGEVERRTNPSFNDNIKENDKKKKKNKKKDKSKKKENNDKKNDNKNEQNKDIEGKYADQVLCRPNVVKMRKTLIFTSDPEKIKEGLKTLSKDDKEKLNPNIVRIKGELPEPRDGQSVCVEGTDLYIFGGDRFKFPFNDLFVLDTVQLPKLPIKERTRKKGDKDKEKDEEDRNKKDNEDINENGEEGQKEDKKDKNKDEENKDKNKDEENKDKNNEDEKLLTLIEKITYQN